MSLTAKEEGVVDLLQRWRIATKQALCAHLLVSHMTVVRALNKYGYYSSCNRNSAYYTLTSIPVFDEDGLWSYEGVCFSRYGTLEASIVQLIERSPAGFTVNELEKRFGTKAGNILCALCRKGRLKRHYSGRNAVYVSADRERESRQWAGREQQREGAKAVLSQRKGGKLELPEDLDAVALIHLLVQMIRTPEASVASLSQTLQARGVGINAEQVRRAMKLYCLRKKRAH